MAPGARSKFGAPMFEPEVFRKQMCKCTEDFEKSDLIEFAYLANRGVTRGVKGTKFPGRRIVILFGLFGAPRSHLPPLW